ncbi:alpha/beta hydrolase [Nakamurella leprariae]|uniref:DUF1023 domain-containing protein n=1 Tax=Nakamurella leprariae TaxID=2803911 RepID=A0A938YCP6_9ACTN|nr:alpha/beta hydrolase [Nakamurella leprariae]MBM9465779.1 hypothetical protein [Nakamurella leprariae]
MSGDHLVTQWAEALRMPDPMPTARMLTALTPETVGAWFRSVGRTVTGLRTGADDIHTAGAAAAAGWSDPVAGETIIRLGRDVETTAAMIEAQLLAVETFTDRVASIRVEAEAALAITTNQLTTDAGPRPDVLLVDLAPDKPIADLAVGAIATLTTALARLSDTLDAAARLLIAALRDDPEELQEGWTDPSAGGPALALTAARRELDDIDQDNRMRLLLDLSAVDHTTATTATGIHRDLGAAISSRPTQLVLYESAHALTQARAAVAVGDLASADHIAVLVPGVSNSPANMAGALQDAAGLADRMEQVSGEQSAVLVWFGYDIPGSTSDDGMGGFASDPWVIDWLKGAGGAAVLGRFGSVDVEQRLLADLGRLRPLISADVHLTGIGFSAGSTVVSATAVAGAPFDDVVLLGSPGAGTATSVDDYPMPEPEHHTWVMGFEDDPVAQVVPGFGVDPDKPDFGAQVLEPEQLTSREVLPLAGLVPLSLVPRFGVGLVRMHRQDRYLQQPQVAEVAAGRYDRARRTDR